MGYTPRMDDFDKQVRRSALKLVAVGFLLGLLVGFIMGVNQGDKTIAISLTEGIRT